MDDVFGCLFAFVALGLILCGGVSLYHWLREPHVPERYISTDKVNDGTTVTLMKKDGSSLYFTDVKAVIQEGVE